MDRILEGKYFIYKLALGVFTDNTDNIECAEYKIPAICTDITRPLNI